MASGNLLFLSFSVLIIWTLCSTFAMERKLKTELNPGCSTCSRIRPLIHITGDSDKDTIHHIWDFTGIPSVLIAHTDLNTSLYIDWDSFPAGSIHSFNFSTHPHYVFSYIFDQVIDFNDVNNTGVYNNETQTQNIIYETKGFTWNLTDLHYDSHISKASLLGTNHNLINPPQRGSIKIMLTSFGIKDHSLAEPHLLHTTNTTQLDVSLEHFSARFSQTRFALRFIAVSSDQANASVSLKTHKAIDDEHSPGIFTVGEYITPGSEEGHAGGGYLQWRTVAYTSAERALVNSTATHQSAPYTLQNPDTTLSDSLVYRLVGYHVKTMSIHSFHVSFGAPDDSGYYAKTSYLYWSMLAGYGQPSGESISLLVIVLISLALNLVSLLAVVAYVLIFTRRIRRNKNDLFFSH